MKVERANQLLPLFKHFAGGGEIQSQPDSALADVDFSWRDNPDPKWCDDCLYRKKPELLHGFVNVYSEIIGQTVHKSFESAEANAGVNVIRIGVEVQEVVK